MQNSFFKESLDPEEIKNRIYELRNSKVGFYSIGLYPASLAYNAAMQGGGDRLLLANRPGRELLGAFEQKALNGMDKEHIEIMQGVSVHQEGNQLVPNTLEYLIKNCELVVLSANSNHIEKDLADACDIRKKLNRDTVVLACLAGAFTHNEETNESYVLCEKYPNLAFFSGFHRHGALRDPVDSFTANFCHPNALTALLGAYMIDKISLNIQVSPGIHNVEAQYIKAAKNMASIFAGFVYTYHAENPGILPTVLTLLLDQCLDQAATVSILRSDRAQLYFNQSIALTELGYGVPRIEATLNRGGNMEKVRDHTFSQLTAIVADVRGSMMQPITGKPTRNFQAGQVLAYLMRDCHRCPVNTEEFEEAYRGYGLNTGSLEGLKALKYWPQIKAKYGIQPHDSSMINLLYMSLYGGEEEKTFAFEVMTQSRELSNYCQESVRPSHSRKYAEALNNLDKPESMELIVNAIIADNAKKAIYQENGTEERQVKPDDPAYIRAMNSIEAGLN